MHAAREGHDAVVEILVARKECDINLSDKYGFTALILAAGMGNFEIVKLLTVSPRVDVNVVEGNTCLITACYKNHPLIVARLLARPDVNPNWTSEAGDRYQHTDSGWCDTVHRINIQKS